jgi:hypothetical protein
VHVLWQPLLPLQKYAPHSFAGSCPSPMGLHVPVLFAHAWQRPPHSVLQHVLSTQWAVAHCVPVVQAAPSGSTHAPFMHVVPMMQSAVVVHVVGQLAAPLQTNGAHDGAPAYPAG